MEILRINVRLTGSSTVEGAADKAVLLPFTGECACPLFTGRILPGGVDTQRILPDGRGTLSARYMLEGVDDRGQACRLFIENSAVMQPGVEMVTHPVLRTDSESLRWLETTDLTGRIEHFPDHIEIVIDAADTAQRRHIALTRDGLTLRGLLEKKADGPCPLVLMLHGFGGCMDAYPGGWLQEYSDALTAAGFATLRFDFAGHGQSEGQFREMTPYSLIADAMTFLQSARALPDVTELHLLGHSQGGVIAGMLAGYCREQISKLVMLAPAASLKADAQQGTCLGTDYDPVQIPAVVRVLGRHDVGSLYFRMAQSLPIHEVTRLFAGPALAVIGGRDQVVSPEAIRRYGEVMPACRITEKPTLDHRMAGTEHDNLVQEIVDFLQKR